MNNTELRQKETEEAGCISLPLFGKLFHVVFSLVLPDLSYRVFLVTKMCFVADTAHSNTLRYLCKGLCVLSKGDLK